MTERKQQAVAKREAPQHTAALAEMSEGFTAPEVEVIREQVANGATDAELAVFLRLAAKYDLDPFAREIWCIVQLDPSGERKADRNGKAYPAIIAASRDGWLKVAQREPAFDGMVSDAVYQHDEFQPTADGPVHKYGWKEEGAGSAARLVRGKLLGGYAYVYRKDRRVPAYSFAPWAEYGKPNVEGDRVNAFSPWARTPSAMIKKVAEHNALKRAFSLSGLTSLDDIGQPDPQDDAPETPDPPPSPERVAELRKLLGVPEQPPEPPVEGSVVTFTEAGDIEPADGLQTRSVVEEKTGQKPPWAEYRPGEAQVTLSEEEGDAE